MKPSLNKKVKALRPNLQHNNTNQVGATGFLVMAGSNDQSVVAVGLGQKRIYKAMLKDQLDAEMQTLAPLSDQVRLCVGITTTGSGDLCRTPLLTLPTRS